VPVHPGDWIVRQPGGEIQYIRERKYCAAYRTVAEAEALGLYEMIKQGTFSGWVKAQAVAAMQAGLRSFVLH